VPRREPEKKHKTEEGKEKPGMEAGDKEKVEAIESPEMLALQKELEEQKKMYLYLRADFENYKRNTNKERLELAGRGEDNVLKQVFGLLESLERAIKYAQEHKLSQPVIDGLELVRREIFLVFEKFKVAKIETQGQKFDPQFHEAVAVVDAKDMTPGMVLKEERPGFIREGRVLQPARVVVVKEPSEALH